MGLTVGELNILLEGEVDDFLRDLQVARRSLNKFTDEAERDTSTVSRSFAALGVGVGGVVAAFGALGGALAAVGIGRLSFDALEAEAAFGQLLGQIQTLVGVSTAELAELRQGVLDISRETGRGPEELASALFAVTSAGQRGSEALTTLQAAAQASAAGLGETRSVALAAVAATTAFADQSLSTADAFDVLLATVREGNLEASELASSLGTVLGPAAQVGASFADVGASIAAFTRLGVSASEAVTGLQSTFALLLSPTDASAEALAQVGLTAREIRESIGEQGLARTLVDLVERFEALGPAGQELLAEAVPNIRAFSSVLGTAGAQSEEFIRINDALAESQGTLDTAFTQTTERLDFQISRLTSGFDRLQIAFGSALAPGVADALTNVILPAFEAFEEQVDANAGSIAAFGRDAIPQLLNALGALLQVLAFVVRGFGLLIDSFRALRVSGAAVQEVIVFLVNGFESLRRVQTLLINTSVAQFQALGAALRGNFGQAREIISGAIDEVRDFNLVTQEQVDRQVAAREVTRQAFAEFNAGTPLVDAAADALDRAGTAAAGAGAALEAQNEQLRQNTQDQQDNTDAIDENTNAKERNAAAGAGGAQFTEAQVAAQTRLAAAVRATALADVARLDPLEAQALAIDDQIAKLRALAVEAGTIGAEEGAINTLLENQARLRAQNANIALETAGGRAGVEEQLGQLARIDPEAARELDAQFARAFEGAQTAQAQQAVVQRFGDDLQRRLDAVTPPPLSEQVEQQLQTGFRAFLEGDAPAGLEDFGNLLEDRVFDSLENAFARSLDVLDQEFGSILDGLGDQISGLFDGAGDGAEGGGLLGRLGGAVAGLAPLIGAGITSALRGSSVETTRPELDRGEFMQTEAAVRGIVAGGVDVPIFRVGQQIERANVGVIRAIERQTTQLVAAIQGTGVAAAPSIAAANLLEEESTTIA